MVWANMLPSGLSSQKSSGYHIGTIELALLI